MHMKKLKLLSAIFCQYYFFPRNKYKIHTDVAVKKTKTAAACAKNNSIILIFYLPRLMTYPWLPFKSMLSSGPVVNVPSACVFDINLLPHF